MGELRYKLIIFDFDGTLADSFQCFVEATVHTTQRFGLRTIDPAEFEMLRSYSAREMIAYLGLPFWKLPLVVRYMRRIMTASTERIGLFPGVEDLLRQLAQNGATLAIVSSNSEANVRAILGPANSQLFACYACGASIFGKAPRFREVIKRTGVLPSETISIGDEIRDLEAAQTAGIDFGAVSWGYTNADALAKLSPSALFIQPVDILTLNGSSTSAVGNSTPAADSYSGTVT